MQKYFAHITPEQLEILYGIHNDVVRAWAAKEGAIEALVEEVTLRIMKGASGEVQCSSLATRAWSAIVACTYDVRQPFLDITRFLWPEIRAAVALLDDLDSPSHCP